MTAGAKLQLTALQANDGRSATISAVRNARDIHPVRNAALFALAGRAIFSGIAALFAPHLRLDSGLIASNALTGYLMSPSLGWRYAWLGTWERFDTLWYIHISQSGYDTPAASVFYPLYPALIRMSGILPLVAALVISTVAAFFFALGLQRLVLLDHPSAYATRALLLYLAWPAGFMLFAGYPETLLACWVVWGLYFARRGALWAALVFCVLAGSTKAVGAVVAVPVAVIALQTRRWRVLTAAAGAFVPAALFQLWVHSAFGMTAREVYQQYWRTQTVPPWETLWLAVRSISRPDVRLNLIALITVVLVVLVKRQRLEHAAFVLCLTVMLLAKVTTGLLLTSTLRYVLVAFPAFVAIPQVFQKRLTFASMLLILVAIELQVFHVFLEWGLIV